MDTSRAQRGPRLASQPRPWVRDAVGYVPGSTGADDHLSLASNEVPFAPTDCVLNAITRELTRITRYPDPLATQLRERLASHHDVDPAQILVGNGSDQLMYLLVLAYASGGGIVACADPGYGLYRLIPQVMGASTITVPLNGWTHDLERMADESADLLFICNPHNPTGTTVTGSAIELLIEMSPARLIVVDEAYVDFCDAPDETTSMGAAARGEAVVLRTFSKSMGLAGLRIGYAVGSREVIETLRAIRPVYSVNSLAQAAAGEALRDRDHHARVTAFVADMRGRLTELFRSRGYRPLPSEANFVLVLVPDESALCDELSRRGISVRPGSELGVPGSIRVAVPSEQGFAALADALAEIDVSTGSVRDD